MPQKPEQTADRPASARPGRRPLAAALVLLWIAAIVPGHSAACQQPAPKPTPKPAAKPRPPAAPAASAAQAPATPAGALDFTTADGTRVVLLPIGGPPLVHWAVATPCGALVDPPSVPGLAEAIAAASLRGTWRTGSRDAAQERAALDALDAAERDLQSAPRTDGKPPPELAATVARLQHEVLALGDPQAFRRVLAATPVDDLELRSDGRMAVLQLTTAPFAVPQLARLLKERREEPALRGFRYDLQQWQTRATAAWDAEPMAPLYAEVLAQAFPGHPLARSGDRPASAGCQRAQALATWARSQHPSRSVHVLIGNFDPQAVQQVLQQTFADTALPTPDALPEAVPRAQPALRRALVPGARHPAAVLAFALPAGVDPVAAATAARWFADGDGSWLAQELVRQGRKKIAVAVRAPWPDGAATGLLAIEVADPAGGDPALADEVLKLCAAAVAKQPRPGELPAAYGSVLRAFEQRTRRPADQAALFATRLWAEPTRRIADLPPRAAAFAELPALLQRILDGNPIVIEWRDA